MDYMAFFNKASKNRHPSALRQMFDVIGVSSDYVHMGGGLPNPEVFPIKSLVLNLKDGSNLHMTEESTLEALQYGKTSGTEEIRKFLTELTLRLHDPPTMRDPKHPGTHKILVTSGSQDGIFKTFELLFDEGDTLLTEEYTYPNVIAVVNPIGCHMQPLKTDQFGIIPESLKEALSQWPKPVDGKPSLGKLKAIYCVPNGDNPIGVRYSIERKKEIYRLAHEYNFLIIEDDAYYFLEEMPAVDSFLSIDVDGRVIRLETFSKTVAPGFRLGYFIAPKPIFDRMTMLSQCSTQGSSVLSQMIIMELIKHWGGVDGFLTYSNGVNNFYAERRKMCLRIAKKHLNDLAEWTAPTGGMFLWIKIIGIEDSMPVVTECIYNRKVLVFPGGIFQVVDGVPSPCIRISFSMATEADLEQGFAILAEEIRKTKKSQRVTNDTLHVPATIMCNAQEDQDSTQL